MARLARISVYLSKREVEIFKQVKEDLGEDDTGTFTYLLKAYADVHSLIYEALPQKMINFPDRRLFVALP